MPDVRIPQELASRWVIENDNVRDYTPPRGERYAQMRASLDMLECIKPQFQPAYRVGDMRVDIGDRLWIYSWQWRWVCLSANIFSREPEKTTGLTPTGLNLVDLIEHLKKGPVVCLTQERAKELMAGPLTTNAREQALGVICDSLNDWLENQKK